MSTQVLAGTEAVGGCQGLPLQVQQGRQASSWAWRYVIAQRGVADICRCIQTADVYRLYVLSQLIPTQSADVERGFSSLNQCLGLTRLKASIVTLDCMLRIKQNVPGDATEDALMSVGVEPEAPVSLEPGVSMEPNAVACHRQLVLPNAQPLLVQQLHDQLNIEQSILWQNTLAAEFEALDTVVESAVSPDVAEDNEELSARNMSLEELERILSGM
jgi:hypothetical protein